jgi:hypothetical protein
MEAAGSCETLLHAYQTSWHHILDNRNLVHRRVHAVPHVSAHYVLQSLSGTMDRPNRVAELQQLRQTIFCSHYNGVKVSSTGYAVSGNRIKRILVVPTVTQIPGQQ